MATWYSCVNDIAQLFDFLGNGKLPVQDMVVITKILIRFLYILYLVHQQLLSLFAIIKIHSLLLMNSLKVAVIVLLIRLLALACLVKNRMSPVLCWADSVVYWSLWKSSLSLPCVSAVREPWIVSERRTRRKAILRLSHKRPSPFLPRSQCILLNSLPMLLNSLITSPSSLPMFLSSLPMLLNSQVTFLSSLPMLLSSLPMLLNKPDIFRSMDILNSNNLIIITIVCFYTDSLPEKEYHDASIARDSFFRLGWRWNSQLWEDQLWAWIANFFLW